MVPLVVVPPMLGTRLRDPAGRPLWGWTRNLFFGRPVGRAPAVTTDGLLEELSMGLFSRDVHGGLIRRLGSAGYSLGRNLFVLTYDWRQGIERAAEDLAALIAERATIDILALSSGGLAVRAFLTRGRERVRRVVYVGTPQRGTLESMNVLQNGFKLVPLIGKRYPPEDMSCQITYDLLPPPEDSIFSDERGRTIEGVSLYDADAWRALGLRGGSPALLARARALHDVLAVTPAHDAFLIGARHLPTRGRLVIEKGRALVPDCWMKTPHRDHVSAMGDGSVCEDSMRGLPGITRRRIAYVRPAIHHDLPSDPRAQQLALDALTGTW